MGALPGPGRIGQPLRLISRSPAWQIVQETGGAGDLHAASATALDMDPPRRTARVLNASRPALVLGSSQPESDFDPAALARSGLEVVRRRSGGGAVIVGPGRVLWLDLLLPTGDPLWDDDVGRAAWWVGELWLAALERTGCVPERTTGCVPHAEVWKGPMVPGRWAAQVCFAGLGPGEVRIDGRKVVGVSQRRTRRMALFQTAAILTWRPEEYLALMPTGHGDKDLAEALTATATGLGAEAEHPVRSALLELLVS